METIVPAAMEDLFIGNYISIYLNGCASSSSVIVHMIHCEVEKTTLKAVKIRNDKGFLWIPKKALKTDKTTSFKLAHWFKPDYEQNRTIERMSEFGAISV